MVRDEIVVGQRYVINRRHPCRWIRGETVTVVAIDPGAKRYLVIATDGRRQRVLAPAELSPLPSEAATAESGEDDVFAQHLTALRAKEVATADGAEVGR